MSELYLVTKGVHNILRWVVVFGAVWALLTSFRGLFTRAAWTNNDRRAGLVFSSALGLQLIVGLLLYGISPLITGAMQNMSAAMQNTQLRFFVAEHSVIMILAVVAAQLGYSLSKRAHTDRAKFVRSSLGYGLATLLVLYAIPWPGLSYGRPLLPWYWG